jgi:acid phosphatase type 7
VTRSALRAGVAAAGVVVVVAGISRCGGSPSSPGPIIDPAPNAPQAVLAGAGDIGVCGSPAVAATSLLLDRIQGIVFTTGDHAYPSGSAADFRDCYDPHWGRHRARTRPTPGNHDYQTAGGAEYYSYFAGNAGPPGVGYYRYSAGPWVVISLNSEVPVGPGSAQLQWLRAELASGTSPCAMAYWHRPLFTSGPNGPNLELREIWRTLYEFGIDLVVTGHDHLYERFAPQDPDGRLDRARGIRQITVGTGGAALYTPITSAANTEAIGLSHGILMLTLSSGSYRWEFLPVPGSSFTDSGIGQCH